MSSLPQLHNCIYLHCSNNQLTSLSQLHNCKDLYCSNNQLAFEELDKWQIVWKARRLYLQIKYFRLWYKFMLQSKAKKKAELHLELKYSPDLPFYKETKEYKHWLNCLQQSHFVRWAELNVCFANLAYAKRVYTRSSLCSHNCFLVHNKYDWWYLTGVSLRSGSWRFRSLRSASKARIYWWYRTASHYVRFTSFTFAPLSKQSLHILIFT